MANLSIIITLIHLLDYSQGTRQLPPPPTITASDNCLGGNCRGEEGAIALGGNCPGGLSSGQFSGRQLYGGQLPK